MLWQYFGRSMAPADFVVDTRARAMLDLVEDHMFFGFERRFVSAALTLACGMAGGLTYSECLGHQSHSMKFTDLARYCGAKLGARLEVPPEDAGLILLIRNRRYTARGFLDHINWVVGTWTTPMAPDVATGTSTTFSWHPMQRAEYSSHTEAMLRIRHVSAYQVHRILSNDELGVELCSDPASGWTRVTCSDDSALPYHVLFIQDYDIIHRDQRGLGHSSSNDYRPTGVHCADVRNRLGPTEY